MSQEQTVFLLWLFGVGTNHSQNRAAEKQSKAYPCSSKLRLFSKGLRRQQCRNSEVPKWQHEEEDQMGLLTPNFWGKCKPSNIGFKRMKKLSPKTKMKSSLELRSVSPWMSQVWLLVPRIHIMRWKPSKISWEEHCLLKPGWRGTGGRFIEGSLKEELCGTTPWAAEREEWLMADGAGLCTLVAAVCVPGCLHWGWPWELSSLWGNQGIALGHSF